MRWFEVFVSQIENHCAHHGSSSSTATAADTPYMTQNETSRIIAVTYTYIVYIKVNEHPAVSRLKDDDILFFVAFFAWRNVHTL